MVFSNLQLTVNKTRLKLYEKQKYNNAHTNCMGIYRLYQLYLIIKILKILQFINLNKSKKRRKILNSMCNRIISYLGQYIQCHMKSSQYLILLWFKRLKLCGIFHWNKLYFTYQKKYKTNHFETFDVTRRRYTLWI
jgi:hypothetical protein